MEGIYAGSFDPIHRGHMAVIEVAARRLDVVWVAVMGNPDKPSGMYSIPERLQLIERATSHLDHVRAIAHAGLTVELAESLGVDVLVRGVAPRGRGRYRPSPTEVAAEHEMAEANRVMSGLRTMFVPSPPETAHISGRAIRELYDHHGAEAIRELLPPVPPGEQWAHGERSGPDS